MKKRDIAIKVRVKTAKTAKVSGKKVKRASILSRLFSKANYVLRYVFVED